MVKNKTAKENANITAKTIAKQKAMNQEETILCWVAHWNELIKKWTNDELLSGEVITLFNNYAEQEEKAIKQRIKQKSET